jgi:hypothetical protein
MYYEWIQKNKKTIIVVSVVLLSFIIAWGVTTYVTRIGKTAVTLSVVPRDASVTINGSPAGHGTTWVQNGTYTIKASKDGFESRTKQVEVTNEKEQNTVALALTPISEEAKAWAEKHPDAYRSNEAYGAIEARMNGDYFRKKHPVTNVLPYEDPYYTIAYTSENNTDLTITITTPSPRYRYLAVQKFRELGFNPSDFRIKFVDFSSPLEDKS